MPLGNGEVSSGGRMTLFTACLGILRPETQWGAGNISFHFMRLSGAFFSFYLNAFYSGAIYNLTCRLFFIFSLSLRLSRFNLGSWLTAVATGHHMGQSTREPETQRP